MVNITKIEGHALIQESEGQIHDIYRYAVHQLNMTRLRNQRGDDDGRFLTLVTVNIEMERNKFT